MKTQRFLLLAAIFAISFTFFACSDDSPSGSGEQQPSSTSGQQDTKVFCRTSASCSQISLSACMELVNTGAAQIVSNCNTEPPPPSSSSVAPPPPSSSSSAPRPSSSSAASTRCKDTQGREYFCQWGSDCWAIDPTYSPTPGTCSELVDNCNRTGRLYAGSTREGEGISCNGTYAGSSSSVVTPSSSSVALLGTFTDARDGKLYYWTKIGTQTWMGENLNYNVSGSKCPDNETDNCITLGRQYNWATAMGIAASYNSTSYGAAAKIKGICPTGWHLPSATEWNTLENYVGTTPGTKLKAKYGWNNNANGTDVYDFTALPGGYVCYNCSSTSLFDTYPDIGDKGVWWTATEYDAKYAYNRYMDGGSSVGRVGNANYDYAMTKNNMLSVRCVKD